MNRDEILARYARREQELTALLVRHRKLDRGFVVGEVVSFLAAVGAVVLFTVVDNGAWTLWLAAALFVVYVAVRRLDERNDGQTDDLDDLLTVCRREMAYMRGDFSAFDDGKRYADAAHAFAFDLDIFGPMSLFQRIDRTVTTGGSDRLAKHLTTLDYDAQRPVAVDELAKREEFLASFKARGVRHKVDTAAVTKAMHAATELRVPAWLSSPATLAVVWLSIAGLWASIVLALLGLCSGNVPLWWAVAEFFATFFLTSAVLHRVSGVVGTLLKEVAALMQLVRLVRDEEFMSPYNQAIHGRLRGAMGSIGALEETLRRLDRRGNILGMLVVNGLVASDFFTVRRFYLWQQRYQSRFAEWVDAVSEMDALVSMATYRRNEPATQWATVDEQAQNVVYEATALAHPFLGEQAVSNDFSLQDRHFYIITGANMAGKSTFLRSLGISYVMAMAGLPVFAERLTVSRCRLFTSMRTTDDLSHGISYFNAELLRLRQLLESIGQADGTPTLIILDEILKGTNSLDKLNGSRLFLEHVAKQNVTGVVATHDLELSHMAEQRPDRFHNHCFEIALGDSVTYSYRITPGVARNQNATFLLRQLLDAAQ